MSGNPFIPTLHQEICLSPTPASPTSIIHINAKTTSHSSIFGAGRKRTFDEFSGLDEEGYARKHLASEASIFFRRRKSNPRSILWRILDDRQLLEIQSVDLVQTKQHAKDESCLTFHITLPASILREGVALADSIANDALEVFVLTSGNELYTISLRRDLLVKSLPPKDFDSSTCIQRHALASLSFRRPYKMQAVSGTELLISLHDGGLLRLVRQSTSHSALWQETFFSEGGWTGTLRGLLPLKRNQTVRYGDIELEPTAAVALATSPDGQHIWTISLDHELTAWSTQTGKVVARRDLLGTKHDPDEKKPQYVMPAEQGSLLKVFTFPNDVQDDDRMAVDAKQYQVVLYSPKDRAFRLLVAKPGASEEEAPRLHDVMQGAKLSLPFDDLLDTNLWRCTDFQCKVEAEWQTVQFWISVQSGTSSRVLTLSLNLLDEGELVDGWQQQWQTAWTTISDSNARSTGIGPTLDLDGHISPTTRWLAFLLYPGRFSKASLETALHLYQQRRKLPSATSKTLHKSKKSFEERLCEALTAKILLSSASADRPDYQDYYAKVHVQCSAFYSLLLELQAKRLEYKSFAVDMENDLLWIVHADPVAPVRTHDKLERLGLNANLDADEHTFDRVDEGVREQIIRAEDDWDNMKLLTAIEQFADALPLAFRQSFMEMAVAEASGQDQSKDRGTRAQAFFDKADVGQQVTDEAYQDLEQALQPLNGIAGLGNSTFTDLLNILSDTGHRGTKSDYTLNRYGGKLMIAAAQQFIQLNKKMLLAVLALVAFINNDFEDDALDPAFNAYTLFNEIMSKLRHAEMRDWLTRNSCLEPSRDHLIVSTVFESLFIGDWDSHAPKTLTFAEKLTHWSRQWAFAAFNDWHGFTANVFSTLLRHAMHDLAADFSRFLQESSWTTYLRARLHLALGDYAQAAIEFHSAASGLSDRIKGELDTAGLLTADELNHLGQGQELYNLHVANLFEKLKLYPNTADFAQQALSFINEAAVETDFEVIDQRKKSTQSPVETVANARAEVKLLKTRTVWEEIVSRLFNALIQTGRYQEAYKALQKFKSPELQRSNLQKLVDGCIHNDMLETVLDLPFDEAGADNADEILLRLTKKDVAFGNAMRPAQQVLYAFRTRRGNYRGAAQVLYEHLERLRHRSKKSSQDPDDETLPQAYLILINTLACCGEGEEWLLAEPIDGLHSADKRRKLVTLQDIRREYVAELDKRSDLQHGRFPLIGTGDDDEMSVL